MVLECILPTVCIIALYKLNKIVNLRDFFREHVRYEFEFTLRDSNKVDSKIIKEYKDKCMKRIMDDLDELTKNCFNNSCSPKTAVCFFANAIIKTCHDETLAIEDEKLRDYIFREFTNSIETFCKIDFEKLYKVHNLI